MDPSLTTAAHDEDEGDGVSYDDEEESEFGEDEDESEYGEDEEEQHTAQMLGLCRRLPYGWQGRPATGRHRKPCSECGKQFSANGFPTEWYFYCAAQPWGTNKYCENCVEFALIIPAESSDEDEGELSDEDEGGYRSPEKDAAATLPDEATQLPDYSRLALHTFDSTMPTAANHEPGRVPSSATHSLDSIVGIPDVETVQRQGMLHPVNVHHTGCHGGSRTEDYGQAQKRRKVANADAPATHNSAT